MGTIKIIKGVGPRLSTERLEAVSTQLLLARIRGSDPQVSFNFIQRLLDELIQHRRKEELEQLEMDIILSDIEEEVPKGVISLPDVKPLQVESSDGLELSASEYQEITEDLEELPEQPPCDDLEFPELTTEQADELTNILYERTEVEEYLLERPAVAAEPKIEEPAAIEEPDPPAKPKRKPLVLRKQTNLWKDELNLPRILLITLFAALMMIIGVIAL